MNTGNHISNDELYLFALQLLPEAEMHSVALHMKECALCRDQVADIQGDLVAYAMTAELQAPPSQARERLLAQVAKEKKLIPVTREEQRLEPVLYPRNARMFQMEAPEERRSRTPAVLAWTGWLVAAGVAAVAVLQYQHQELLQRDLTVQTAKLTETTAQAEKAQAVLQTLTNEGAMRVSLHIPNPGVPPTDPEGHVAYVPTNGTLVFVATHLDPLQPSKTYELWVLPADKDGKPIPAGLFKPDANGSGSVVLPELPKGVVAKGFAVTRQDEGGSATPTMPMVLVGTEL
jgi:anti-sigma-K factor RskA